MHDNINALTVRIPRHNSKNTTNDLDLHKVSGNRNFTKTREVKETAKHQSLQIGVVRKNYNKNLNFDMATKSKLISDEMTTNTPTTLH